MNRASATVGIPGVPSLQVSYTYLFSLLTPSCCRFVVKALARRGDDRPGQLKVRSGKGWGRVGC